MKLRAIWTGKTRNRDLARVLEDYARRADRLLGLDVVELKEPRTSDDLRRVDEEGRRLLARVQASDYAVVLHDSGRMATSAELARLIGDEMRAGARDVVFLVGGPAGVSPALMERADLTLSLSRMTLSHDLARTILMEQIYRALTIIRNLPYAR